MTSSRNLGLTEGRPVASPGTAPANFCATRAGRRRALVGLAAAATVLTAGCSPLVTLGGGHSTGTKKPASSGHLTYLPVADSFVYADALDRNMGGDARLVASTIPDQGKASFLKFAVSGIPAGRYVTAHLVLHRTDHHLPPTVSVSTAASTWSEMGITGRNAPAISAPIATVHPASAPTSLSVDVSSVVKANETITFAITDPVADTVAAFYARQSGANAPSLVIDYSTTKPASQPVVTPAPTTDPTPTARPRRRRPTRRRPRLPLRPRRPTRPNRLPPRRPRQPPRPPPPPRHRPRRRPRLRRRSVANCTVSVAARALVRRVVGPRRRPARQREL